MTLGCQAAIDGDPIAVEKALKAVAERIAGKRFERDIVCTNDGTLNSSADSGGLMICLGLLSLLTGKPIKPGITGRER